MAWCRPGDKPLSEPMMVSLLTQRLNELIAFKGRISVQDDKKPWGILFRYHISDAPVTAILTHRGSTKITAILQTTFWNAFSAAFRLEVCSEYSIWQ